MKAIKTIVSAFFVLALFFVLFDFCIYFIVFSNGYLMHEYDSFATAERLSMTREDLSAVTEKLTGYVKGKEGSLDIVVSVRGSESLFFNEKDLSHMKDVRNILTAIRDLMLLAFFAVLLSGIFLIYSRDAKAFRNGVLAADGLLVLLSALIAAGANIDLDWMIVFFHNMFFNNSDWLLDPAVDNLIYLCPEQLFIEAGKLCGIIWIVSMIGITVIALVLPKIRTKKSVANTN